MNRVTASHVKMSFVCPVLGQEVEAYADLDQTCIDYDRELDYQEVLFEIPCPCGETHVCPLPGV